MSIAAADVKALRDATGAGMMDCKRALAEAEGDVEKAKDILRQHGLAKGEKRAGRTTGEGCIALASSPDGQTTLALELNCETDFVGRSDDFRALAQSLADAALASGAETSEAVGGDDAIANAVSRIGEAIRVGRLVRWTAGADGLVGYYLHTATHRVAVLVEVAGAGVAQPALAEVAKELGMQVAAMRPLCVDRDGVPADLLEREKEVLRNAEDMAKKPENIREKIIEGRLGKFFSEVCLLDQPYAKDDKKAVQQYVAEAAKAAGGSLAVRRFLRLEVGQE
ncbi:MAG: translation elongation factor Ts [Fimbriimonadaceae bacterium]|nr:translation elongation factor Ts [Fimbriimonadaceae bacterium]